MGKVPVGAVENAARLFVAIIPPQSVIEAIAALPHPDLDGVRWTMPAQWHVTLVFLGNAPIAESAAALEQLRSPQVTAVLGPSVQRLGKRVAMLPVAGLDELAADVADLAADVRESPADHSFVGHITIARARRGIPAAAVGSELLVDFAVDVVHLVRSHLDDSGARYEVISSCHLGEKPQ